MLTCNSCVSSFEVLDLVLNQQFLFVDYDNLLSEYYYQCIHRDMS
jgi:hypothetical protein